MTAFLLLSIIGKALEIRKFIATSDLPARDNKERWAVKEWGSKIPHTEMHRHPGTHRHRHSSSWTCPVLTKSLSTLPSLSTWLSWPRSLHSAGQMHPRQASSLISVCLEFTCKSFGLMWMKQYRNPPSLPKWIIPSIPVGKQTKIAMVYAKIIAIMLL